MTILESGTDFETRVNAVEDSLMTLDGAFAERLAPVIDTFAAALTGSRLPLGRAISGYARAFALDLHARGAAALCDAKVPWTLPATHSTFARQALFDAILLRADGDPLLDELAGTFDACAQLEEVADYGREVVALALVEAAAWRVNTDDLGDGLDAVLDVLDDVAASPRSRIGRPVVDVVREGDDVRTISARLLGDPERWPELVARYNLYPPYVSQQPRTGCLSPGTRLILSDPVVEIREDGDLGGTLALSAEGAPGRQEWDLVPSATGGLDIVTGLDALATDCALRLVTPLGDLPEHPRYGLPNLHGLPVGTKSVLAALAATDTLLEDERVAEVLPVTSDRTATARGLLVQNVVIVPRRGASMEP